RETPVSGQRPLARQWIAGQCDGGRRHLFSDWPPGYAGGGLVDRSDGSSDGAGRVHSGQYRSIRRGTFLGGPSAWNFTGAGTQRGINPAYPGSFLEWSWTVAVLENLSDQTRSNPDCLKAFCRLAIDFIRDTCP